MSKKIKPHALVKYTVREVQPNQPVRRAFNIVSVQVFASEAKAMQQMDKLTHISGRCCIDRQQKTEFGTETRIFCAPVEDLQ